MSRVVELETIILDYIRKHLVRNNEVPVEPDDDLLTGGLVDSVGIMRLIGHLESALEIKIPAADLIPNNFRTVRIMAAYLEQLIG